MASNSNSGLAEDDVESGGAEQVLRRDTSNSTRLVRDIIYKIIPFFGFCLVVFSVGAILVSTLAFNKPIPHQGTLVISILLLSFFLLFSIGFMYLYFRKYHPHVSKRSGSTNPSQPKSLREHHPQDHVLNIAHMPKRLPDKIIPAIPRDLQEGLIRSDTLRGQAPSPNTYIRGAEDHGSSSQVHNTPHELGGSVRQQNHHLAQQREHQTDQKGRQGPSNPGRQGDSEAGQLPSRRERNESIQTNIPSMPHHKQENTRPSTRNTQDNPLGSPSVGDQAQSPSVVNNRRWAVGPGSHMRIPTPRRPGGPRDMPRHGTSRQMPGLNIQLPEPSLQTPPDPARKRSGQLKSPALGAHARNTPKSQTKSSERRRPDDVSPWPYAPSTGRKMSVQDKRESLKGVLQYYGYSPTGDPRKGRDIPSISPQQLPTPFGASLASAQAGLEGEAQNRKNKQLSPYLEHDIIDYTNTAQDSPQPKDHSRLQAVGVRSLSTNTQGKLRVINTSVSDEDHDPLVSNQADQKPIHQIGNESHTSRRRLSFETADPVDDIHQNATDQGRAFTRQAPPGVPAPNQTQEFNPRHPSAVPEALKLVDKTEPRGTSHRSSDYNTLGYNLEMKPQLPTPALFTRPWPPTTACRPPIYEDGEEEEDNGKELPKTPVQTPDQEQVKGPRCGGRHPPRIPERRSSRKKVQEGNFK
ncbi:hypothetical protein E0Z10_g6789 [Xylaria hypoxylon]|uniref:Uncharacterized protein n=1 Tax=Xylaria hypoxylon TaxID=37992 RepID=A0A4Z0YU26_9PEZI|nr:hypothetical protein E0Z10_g6789 [Xylaria hypoxylon]